MPRLSDVGTVATLDPASDGKAKKTNKPVVEFTGERTVTDAQIAEAKAILAQAKAEGVKVGNISGPKGKSDGEPKAPKWTLESCIQAFKDFIIKTGTVSVMKYYVYKADGLEGDSRSDIPSSGTIQRMLDGWPTVAKAEELYGKEFCEQYLKSHKKKTADPGTEANPLSEEEADVVPPSEDITQTVAG